MPTTINYTLSPINPEAHLFVVSCTIAQPNPQGQQFYLPAWIPGSYKIRDFAKLVSNVQATVDGKSLACHKIDKCTWQCAPTTHAITITYEVYAWDLSVRGSHLDQTHGFINGAGLFLCPIDREDAACVVDIQRPTGDAYKTWKVATALAGENAATHAFGQYQAKNYAELIDSPIEMGHFQVEKFIEQGIPHELVFTGLAPNTDLTRITADVQKICAYYLNYFPKPYPMERYVFLIMLLDQGFGGLEHRASCSLHFSKYNLSTAKDINVSEGYLSFLTLCSHEYLHTWLVKSIKPSAFMPYNLHQENYTELLWVFEGFVFYYEDLILVRQGLITPQQYFTDLAQRITRLWRTPGRKLQSVTEASFDAWIKFYQPDEQTPNITISYYLKGGLVALILDLNLRALTANKYSLDQLLLDLWDKYKSAPQGVPDNAIIELVRAQVGAKLDNLLHTMLYTTEELPLTEALALIGVTLTERPALSVADKGEALFAAALTTLPSTVDLGIVFDPRNNQIVVMTCLTGSAAQLAGISAGDVILAVDNLRVDSQTLAQHLARYTVGDKITLHAFRRDQLLSFTVTLQPALPTAVLQINQEFSTELNNFFMSSPHPS